MKIVKTTSNTLKLTAISVAVAMLLSGCNGDSGKDGIDGVDGMDGADGSNGAPGLPQGQFFIANNGESNSGTVSLVDQNANTLNTLTTGANEGIVYTQTGSLVQAGDSDTPLLRTLCSLSSRTSGMYSTNTDTDISGANTGLTNPKGIAFANKTGIIFAADFTGMRISIFGSQAAGDVAPLAEIVTAAQPWDVAFDEEADRLFVALTDGTIAVYDDVIASEFAPTVTRTIVPSDSDGNQISVNAHGIVYEPMSDRLVVSDVGDAAVADDGQLFVLASAATADGATVPTRTISGVSTVLGNPVDIALTGSTLRVAEKSNDAILVFTNIFSGESGDIAPDLVTSTSKPESIAELTDVEMQMDASDNGLSTMPIKGISVTSNPGTAGDTTGGVMHYSATLSSELASFDSTISIESATYTAVGDGYITFDDTATSTGGILVVNRLKTTRDDGMYNTSYDHEISGDSTGLVAPKGIDVSSNDNLIFVADIDATAPGVRIFSTCAAGNVAPLLSLTAFNGASPWDVDYDAATDQAFLALTNGTVAVFEDVVRKLNSGMDTIDGEDRLITPAMSGTAVTAPTNIHGIDYDAQSDSLVISDVGSAADATDGKLYVIPGAGNASGLTDMSVSISGPLSLLGNPVDLMLSNGHVYVAEKSNNAVLRFDNILNQASGDMAPSYSVSFTAPESVSVLLNQ
ncbi:hypothetical protein R1T43_14710 [Alteromonas sp. CI.11.F.A3]|uniref:YncE family protein n=1 Tax=Alteromonas sp. CI.11.F.A3 TaxID=3079555 RepID=UPI002943E5F0|nr:hypothetical protein [Alteromonas sp. CI.11.F.A3]WOI36441.1 hypothetical protein R1T43_14710 [Alteromonas sp. CI.11.F.A3]